MFKWNKIGHIFDPVDHETPDWMQEFAQLPYPVVMDDQTVRIYFATRPSKGGDNLYVSRSGYIDVSRQDFTKVLNISEKPVFDLGGAGTFDEFGSMTSSFIERDNTLYAYYTGWQRMQSVPYTMAIGVALSKDGGNTFNRYSDGPILGITAKEPFLVSGPIVKHIDGQWHMWYLNGTKWLLGDQKLDLVYKVAHATSEDGINWDRDGKSILTSVLEDECQVSFALFQHQNRWNVIFAYRKPLDFRNNSKNSYRLGYAWSTNLENWTRDDYQLGLTVSDEGWDSEMIAYPQVFQMDGRIFIFYCGNGFGKAGFGAVELIQ